MTVLRAGPSAHSLEPTDGPLTVEELRLAARNHAMPVEAVRHELTPAGLHYLLVHFDIPDLDPTNWRLRVDGLVGSPMELTLDQLRSRRRVTLPVTMECAGNGRAGMSPRPLSQPWLGEAVGTAEWTGTPLAPLLADAGLDPAATEVAFIGADRGIQGDDEHDYGRSLSIADATRPEVLLAYGMNGAPLPVQHGYPLRLVVPGWYGMASVKWLTRVAAVSEPYQGFQQAVAYRYQADADDPGTPVDRMRVRALMTPPGIPDFFTRQRVADPGLTPVRGRAWSGHGAVERVELGVDGHWREAILDPPLGEFAWRGWHAEWDATAGEHELTCRATDSTGAVQPLQARWNYQGMGNNAVQRVGVTVR